MYKVIDLKTYKKRKQYNWFSTFNNPCYGFDVNIDVTNVVNYSKKTKTSFFINFLYLVTISMNRVDELRMRIVDNELRLYDSIDPTFTVMTDIGVYENCYSKLERYNLFYKNTKKIIEETKHKTKIDEGFNSDSDYSVYYMTCVPWISLKGMTHPIPEEVQSNSVPRVCWDKYVEINGRYHLTLNITVSHTIVDGKPLSDAFLNIKNSIENVEEIFK